MLAVCCTIKYHQTAVICSESCDASSGCEASMVPFELYTRETAEVHEHGCLSYAWMFSALTLGSLSACIEASYHPMQPVHGECLRIHAC